MADLTEQEQIEQNRDYLVQLSAARKLVTPEVARTTSDFVRNNPGLSPDTAVASMTLKEMRDNPGVAELVRADYASQGILMRSINNTLGRVTRPVTAGFYDVWDSTVTQPIRFAVQQYQNPDKSIAENLGRSTGTIAAQAQRSGTSVTDILFGDVLGTGLVAGRPDNPIALPGAGTHLENELRSGVDFSEAMSNTEEWVYEKYGANIVGDAWSAADATTLHVGVNGVGYDYGVSIGRMAVTPMFKMQILTPHTLPANLISGSIDFYTQISLDPLDPAFAQLTRWFSVRKMLRPEGFSKVDDVFTAHGGAKLTQAEVGLVADDVVFYGGDEASSIVSRDLDSAVSHAARADDGRVYAVPRSELSPEMLNHLDDVGSVRQVKVGRELTDAEKLIVSDTVEKATRLEEQAGEAEDAFASAVDDLRYEDPEFDEFMGRWEEYGADPDGRPTMTPDQYVLTYMDQDSIVRYSDLLEARDKALRRVDGARRIADGLDPDVAYRIAEELGYGHKPEHFSAPGFDEKYKAISPDDAEEMMRDGWFYANGGEVMRAAKSFVTDDLGLVKPHGRFEAKDPQQWLEGRGGDGLSEWLANPVVPIAAKVRQLRAMGVPIESAWNLVDNVEHANRVAAAGIQTPKWEHPGSTFNDFNPFTRPGAAEGGIDELTTSVDRLLEALAADGHVNELGNRSAIVSQLVDDFLKANPHIDDATRKRLLHDTRIADALGDVSGKTPEEIENLKGLASQKLSDLRDKLKVELETAAKADAEKLQASLNRHAKVKPDAEKLPANFEEAQQMRIAATEAPPTGKAAAKDMLTRLVNNRTITKQGSRPGRLANSMNGEVETIAGEVKVTEKPRGISDWGRRWKAHSTESSINPYDFDTTFDSVTQFLDTIKSSPETIDRIIRQAWAARGDLHASLQIANEVMKELELAIVRNGIDEDVAAKLIRDYLGEQKRMIVYTVDRAGNKIGQADSLYTLERGPGGLEFKVLLDEPINDAEMAIQAISIPSIRDARRVTAPLRAIMQKLDYMPNPLKIGPNVADRLLDGFAAGWRNVQLLRPGWMTSVIPDEMGRAAAQGHLELVGNPAFAWGIAMHGTGNVMPSGNLLDEAVVAMGGYGAGRAARTMADEPLLGGGARGIDWEVKEVLDEGGNLTDKGAEYVARNIVGLYQSKLYKALYNNEGNIDDAIYFLTKTEEGKAILRDIAEGQGRGAIPSPKRRMGRISNIENLPADEVEDAIQSLRINLEALHGEVLLHTGGDYVRRNPDRPGEWLNSGGGKVELYDGWSKEAMWQELLRRNPQETGRYSVGGRPQGTAELRKRLLESDGIPVDLGRVPGQQSYVTIKDGSQELQDVIGVGKRVRGELDIYDARTVAYKNTVERYGIHQENAFVVQVFPDGTYRVHSRPNMMELMGKSGDGTEMVLVDASKLTEEQQLRLMEGASEGTLGAKADELKDEVAKTADSELRYEPQSMRRLNKDKIEAEAAELSMSSDEQLLSPRMEVDDMERFKDYIRDEAYSKGYAPPERVKGPSAASEERLAQMEPGLTDKIFTLVGQKPTEILVRNPYTRIKAWEHFADFYIYGTEEIRTEIRAAAKRSKIPSKQFDKFIERQMRIAGVDELPVPSKVQLTMDEMEKVVIAKTVQETRDLFFDLSKRGNWADAAKLIFPFGDAWWEVLTRWGALFNPMKAEEFGRPFKNVHRLQQATMGAERAGWFETNENGDRVFRWFPGAALATAFMNNPDGFQMTNTAAVNQLMFIDFSDIRQVIAPGMGPYMQIPASWVRPLDGTKAQALIDWAVFGTYNPGEKDAEGVLNQLMPSWMKKTYAMMKGGAYDEQAASLTINIANGLYASGDSTYANVATDPMVLHKLMADSRDIAQTYLWVELVASAFLPAQPKAVVQVVNSRTDGTERIVELLAVADDFHFLSSYMTPEKARATIYNWYGEDPITVAPKSYGVLYRPVTRGAYDFVNNETDFMAAAPLTAAAFMPMTPGEPFYDREYNREIDAGERQRLTPEEAFQYLGYRQGQARFYEVKDEYDRRLAQAEVMYGGTDNDQYRDYKKSKADVWYADAKMSLEAMYFGYSSSASGTVKLRKRPMSEDLLLEMLEIGRVGGSVNTEARKVNPELTGYLETITDWWRKNDGISAANGVDASWWYSSATQADPTPQILRDQFQSRTKRLIEGIDDVEMRQRVKWYVDAVMTPLMQGYGPDAPFIVDIDPLLAPEG